MREGMQCIKWKTNINQIKGTPEMRGEMNTESITRVIAYSPRRKQIEKACNADIWK